MGELRWFYISINHYRSIYGGLSYTLETKQDGRVVTCSLLIINNQLEGDCITSLDNGCKVQLCVRLEGSGGPHWRVILTCILSHDLVQGDVLYHLHLRYKMPAQARVSDVIQQDTICKYS